MTMHQQPLKGDTDIAVKFLKALRLGPWTLASIDPAGGAPTVVTFKSSEHWAMRKWIDKRNGKRNLYFLPNRAKGFPSKKPSESEIEYVDYEFVDIDPLPGETPDHCQQRSRSALAQLPLPPTLVWPTGYGVQAAWRIEDPVAINSTDDLALCKERNIGLIEALGGKRAGVDACQNVDRILRLPGTVNLPNAKKRAAGRHVTVAGGFEHYPDRSYFLFEFPVRDQETAAALNSIVAVGDPVQVSDLSALNLPARIVEIIEDGRVAGEKKDKDDSRSAWEAEAIFGMFRANIANETILGILTNPEFQISERSLENRDPTDYARKSIERLRRRFDADNAKDFADTRGPDIKVAQDEFREFTADSFAGKEVSYQGWVVEDLIVAGDVTLGMGDGGAGKTTLMLQLTVAVAAGRPWLDREVASGKVLYFSGEEPITVIHRRLDDIINGASSPYTHPRVGWPDLAGLKIIDRSEQDALLAVQDRQTTRVAPTGVYQMLEAKVQEWKPTIIILDSLYDVFGGDENAKAQVKQFVNLMRRLARRHDVAVIIIGHPSLSGMSTGSGTSGSTAWNNAVRSRFYLTSVKDGRGNIRNPDMRQLKSMKQNYGRPDLVIDLAWENGIYVPVTEDEAKKRATLEESKKVFLQLLDQYNSEDRSVSHKAGPSYAPTTFANDHRSSGFDKYMLKDAMDTLLADKAIKSETFGPPSKVRTRLVRVNDRDSI